MSLKRRKDSGTSLNMEFTPLVEEHNENNHATDLRGDRTNIAILLFLYLLQGIPIGLTAAIPMLLQNRGASYKQQVCTIFYVS